MCIVYRRTKDTQFSAYYRGKAPEFKGFFQG